MFGVDGESGCLEKLYFVVWRESYGRNNLQGRMRWGVQGMKVSMERDSAKSFLNIKEEEIMVSKLRAGFLLVTCLAIITISACGMFVGRMPTR
jgi:hypothetical protein